MKFGLRIGWKLARLRKNPANDLICPICGAKFNRRGKRKTLAKQVCCSRKCKAQSQVGKKIFGFNLKPKRGKIQHCQTCNKAFQHPPSRKAIYCSHKCYAKNQASFDAIRGANHYNWKGGITSKNVKLRNSVQARAWTISVFKRDGFKCKICGASRNLEAHHKFHWSNYPANRFDLWNGITLCDKCHRAIHIFGRRVNGWIEKATLDYDY